MRLIAWLKTRSCSFRMGLIIAVLHFVFAAFVVLMIGVDGGGAQWQMGWCSLDSIDFPASFLLWHIVVPVVPNICFYFLPEPVDSLSSFIVPAVFFIVVGSSWYFYLPIILEKISKKIADSKTGRIIAILLMLIPFFPTWIEIISYEMNILLWIDYLAPLIWTSLFIWLFFTESKRKRVLFLLCLMPIVSYNLFHYLYVCVL